MIKKLLLVLVALMPMCVSAQIVKIAVVNIQHIYNACPEKAAAEKVLTDLSKQYVFLAGVKPLPRSAFLRGQSLTSST